MYAVRYGGKKGKKVSFAMSSDMVAIRTDRLRSLRSSLRTRAALSAFSTLQPVANFLDAAVSVYRVAAKRGAAEVRDVVCGSLKKEKAVRFAGCVLRDRKSHRPVLYTENLFVQFSAEASNRACKKLLKSYGLRVKREYEHNPNTFFVGAREGCGLTVFELGESLLKEDLVELCHPELVRERRARAKAFAQQWHLKKTSHNGILITAHARVQDAWTLSTGKNVTIAVIDDGVDVRHKEFRSNGKIIKQHDFEHGTNDATPKVSASPNANPPDAGDAHGTACAGVACANGKHGASGVAPGARLMPLRIPLTLGSQAEHDAFIWAADNKADVISCSWGPVDSLGQVTLLPDSTRTAIEHAVKNGRGGKGCVITWAAGNGNESVDKDGYASNPLVITVAACNDQGQRSEYSDKGKSLWCAFPSDDRSRQITPGIWTTDRSGVNEGYNSHNHFWSDGDLVGHYASQFGGTSSACPGVAGVVALMLSKNPELTWMEVREIIKKSCDKIDKTNAKYHPTTKHSKMLGFGRVNAKKAVKKA